MTTVDTSSALAGSFALANGGPREVASATARRFGELMAAPGEAAAPGAPQAGTAAQRLGLDIEQALMAHVPPADASPAEFAMGMLRTQVAVSQAAIGIELLSKTTQTLSQGVQSLTTRA